MSKTPLHLALKILNYLCIRHETAQSRPRSYGFAADGKIER